MYTIVHIARIEFDRNCGLKISNEHILYQFRGKGSQVVHSFYIFFHVHPLNSHFAPMASILFHALGVTEFY